LRKFKKIKRLRNSEKKKGFKKIGILEFEKKLIK